MSPAYRAALDDRVPALAEALGRCTDAAHLAVHLADGDGAFLLTGAWRDCAPTVAGDAVTLTPLIPAALALAHLRDALAAEHDPRWATFRAGIGVGDCPPVWLGGQIPPDGTTFARCAGDDCPPEAPGAGVVRLVAPALAACLR
ncbi:MAG: hypothetical protein R3F59_01695 [Myxococcota bacterium]